MTTIKLPIFGTATGRRDYADVDALIVDVAPHLAHVATFAVHRMDYWADGATWRITNVETGCSVDAADAETSAECIANARAYLAGKTEDDILAAYAAAPAEATK